MSDERDPDDVLHRLVPADLADRLLAGRVDPVDVSPAVDDVAALLEDLRAPETLEERAATSAAAAAFAASVRAGTAVAPLETSVLPFRRPRVKAFAAIATVAVLSAGTAAAATGSLPDPAQRGVASALSRLGIGVPGADDDTSGSADDQGDDEQGQDAPATSVVAETTTSAEATTTTPQATATTEQSSSTFADTTIVGAVPANGVGPDPTGPAHHGLCTAYFASGAATKPNGNSVAMRNVEEAAAAAGQTVEEFCADVIDTGDDSQDQSGESVDANGNGNGRSDGTPGATAPGRSQESPSATAPGRNRADQQGSGGAGEDNGRGNGKGNG